MQYLAYCNIAKPWEFGEWQKQLFIPQENPKAML
jgi:hypothetical protein